MKRKWVPSGGTVGNADVKQSISSPMTETSSAPSAQQRQSSSMVNKKKKGNDCIAVD